MVHSSPSKPRSTGSSLVGYRERLVSASSSEEVGEGNLSPKNHCPCRLVRLLGRQPGDGGGGSDYGIHDGGCGVGLVLFPVPFELGAMDSASGYPGHPWHKVGALAGHSQLVVLEFTT